VSILDRVFLVLLALSGLCAGVVAILLGTGYTFGDLMFWSSYPYNLYLIIGGIIAVLLSLRFFFYRLRRSQPDFIVLDGEHGSIRISHETIRQLSNRSGKSIRGVQDFETRVRSSERGIILLTRVRVLPDVELARMSTDIQISVKEYVERTTGVDVEQVVVNITELATSSSAKSAKAWVD
jgi:uncharacterized alkaline shock family protein YloU